MTVRRVLACGWLILALLSVVARATLAAGPDSREVRLAIIGGEDKYAPSSAILAHLEVMLSQQEGLALVERAEIDEILKEHQLAASGLTDPSAAVKLGTLVGAEVLLFVAAIPRARPAACHFQAVEVKTGISLAADAVTEQAILSDTSAVISLVRLAASKVRSPRPERRYLAILGFQNAEPGRFLNGFAEMLEMFLITGLGSQPGIVLLDRDRLDRLTAEAKLTGAELDIKASTVLLDGTVRRVSGGKEVALNGRLRRLGAGEGHPFTVRVPLRDAKAIRGAAIDAILAGLAVRPQPAEPSAPGKEAALFAERSRLHALRQDPELALRCAEAAYALHPTAETRELAVQAWGRMPDVYRRRFRDRPVQCKALTYRAMLRRQDIVAEMCRAQTAEVRQGTGGEVTLLWSPGRIRRSAVEAREPAVAALLDELLAGEERLFRANLSLFAEHYDRFPGIYWQTWGHAAGLVGQWKGQLGRAIGLFRQALTAFETMPEGASDALSSRVVGITRWQALFLRDYVEGRLQADRRLLLGLTEELIQHHDPLIRMMGHMGRLNLDEQALESAHALVNTLVRDLPPTHRYRRCQRHSHPMYHMAWRAVECMIREDDLDSVPSACWRLTMPLLDMDDPAPFGFWHQLLRDMLPRLGRKQRISDADSLARRIVVAARGLQSPTAHYRETAGARCLESTRAMLAKMRPRKLTTDPAWEAYAVTRIARRALSGGDKFLVDGARLYSIAASGLRVSVTTGTLPDLTDERVLAVFAVPGSPFESSALETAVLAKPFLYLGTIGGLYIVPTDGGESRRVAEADGLPSNKIVSMAWLEGRLFLGFRDGHGRNGKSGFAWYDPETGEAELIASSSAEQAQAALDRCMPYEIACILPDQERECLWLSVQDFALPKETKAGLWRFVPSDGTLERVWRWPCRLIRWHGKELLVFAYGAILAVDPADLSVRLAVRLGSSPHLPDGCHTAGAIVNEELSSPLCFDGDWLLSGARWPNEGALCLSRPGEPLAWLANLPGKRDARVRVLQATPYGILAVDWHAATYLLRRKE